MSEILRPDEVRALTVRVTTERLCRDYLTLWDRNKELEERASFAEAFLPKGHLHD